ncbi:virulence RhuM family protein [Actomonas aquatica]|uniref:Virulence RhuM family protein n=1 Tax=Actomonas aquatica TaxID=2866162 RepID=A0ABZ1C9U6_9BACT|nr:virulence RhuM family protein [Opitutus sp. WL0086]WRQ88246.1 virulence RhuM family protein [Opitutus sp. WL0086]
MKNQPEPDSDLILYLTEDGRTRLQVRLAGETVWLSLNQMADLFQRDKSVISRHIKNVFQEGELVRDSVVAESATTAADGKTYQVEFYNLDVIISVGYRVKSRRGTQFRIWATQRLREYIVKGFAMDDERLKNPPGKGNIDYFDELLERIRDIRASERRVYLRVREILALAADYEPTEPDTQVFFQTIQNKLHYAATGKTAAELIAERADSSQPNMGLMAWRTGVVRKADVTIAKNYLREDEIEELNRIVVMFLDFAEDQARRKKQIFLQNWITRLHDFLNLNERAILPDAGKIKREQAHRLAEEEYERFAARRREELEAQGEADLLELLDAEVKKLPKPKKPKP